VEPLALPTRARFVPLSGHPACSPDWCMPRIPGGRFLRRSAPRWAAGWSHSYPRPGRASASARAIPSRLHRGGDRVRAARCRVEDWHSAVASDTARGSGLCTSGVIMSQRVPDVP
jgi:hypothetical protein